MNLTLTPLSPSLSVCRLPANSTIPRWATQGEFVSITRTADELSIVCESKNVPTSAPLGDATSPAEVSTTGHAHTPILAQHGFRALKVEGPLDFSLTGITAALAAPLAAAKIPMFAIATHDTDYILVREALIKDACVALERAGFRIQSQ